MNRVSCGHSFLTSSALYEINVVRIDKFMTLSSFFGWLCMISLSWWTGLLG